MKKKINIDLIFMKNIFKRALNNKSNLKLSSRFEEVPGWDSLGHMRLISEIEKKLSFLGADLLVESLKNIKNKNLKLINQDNLNATYAKKIDKKETKINWHLDSNKVLAHIHALSPNPGAWFEYEKERFKILKVKATLKTGKPGCVIDENLIVACGSNSIQILELQKVRFQTTNNAAIVLRCHCSK